jgi:hypothetical protein
MKDLASGGGGKKASFRGACSANPESGDELNKIGILRVRAPRTYARTGAVKTPLRIIHRQPTLAWVKQGNAR